MYRSRRMPVCALVTGVACVAVLLGCGKKPAGVGVPGIPAVGTPPATQVVTALDAVTAQFDQALNPLSGPGTWPGVEALPRPTAAGGVGADATAGRDDIDAAFGRLWASWDAWPQRAWQKGVQQRTESLIKQGKTPAQARALAEVGPPPPPLRVTAAALPDTPGQFYEVVEADVVGQAAGEWTFADHKRVRGRVEFADSFRVRCNGDLTVKLGGRTPRLTLEANGALIADLVDLQAPSVEVQSNGHLLLRVGPSTTAVKMVGGVHGALVLARGSPQLRIEDASQADHRHVVAAVGY